MEVIRHRTMEMNNDLIKDIIEWDILNWKKSLSYWSKEEDIENKGLICLELGGRKGGLSLWLAMNGNKVICSDLESPEKDASDIHNKYECKNNISYEAINATNIPYKNHFDIIIFKSILGGISRNGNNQLKKDIINQIYIALKPNGKLLFAENLEASFLHKFMRSKFVNWGSEWNYLKYNEVNDLFSSFSDIKHSSVGFLGAFGRTETQRQILGKIDAVIEKFIPKNKRYILIGVAKK